MPRRELTAVVIAALVAACDPLGDSGTTPPLDHVPGPSEIQVVGRITGEAQRDTIVDFELSDGRVVNVDLSTGRGVGQPGGSPAILVLGRDDRGDWIAQPGHQDGLPDGCHVLDRIGYDLGDAIAIDGVRWLKAPVFDATVPLLGQPYPEGTRFCLDEQARVSGVIPP